MTPLQINSFIEAANSLQPGNTIEVTFFKFQTTSNAVKGLSIERIKEIATQCLKALVREGKSCDSLIKGLKNIEKTLKETRCFDSIYDAVPKLPLVKLPNVILTKIFGYVSPQEWSQIEQTAKQFKNRLANDKVWEKTAEEYGLKVPPEKVQEAVLFKHLIGSRFEELQSLEKDKAIELLIPYLNELIDPKMDTKSLRPLMLTLLWAIKNNIFSQEKLGLFFTTFASIKNPEFRKPILIEAIKHLPQFKKLEPNTPLLSYLQAHVEHESDIVSLLVDKYDRIQSDKNTNDGMSVLCHVCVLFQLQVDTCITLMHKIIRKGDRLLDEDRWVSFSPEIIEFIKAEVNAADASKK